MFRSGVSRRSAILVGAAQTTVFNRFMAKGIDCVLLAAIYFIGRGIWGPLGPVLSALWAAGQDSWGEGQSVGKKITGLRVVDDSTGLGCSFGNSLVRNFPLVIAFLFAPVSVIWAFALFVAVPLLALETYLISSLETGVRVGDVMANTLVTEYLPEQLGAPRADDPSA